MVQLSKTEAKQVVKTFKAARLLILTGKCDYICGAITAASSSYLINSRCKLILMENKPSIDIFTSFYRKNIFTNVDYKDLRSSWWSIESKNEDAVRAERVNYLDALIKSLKYEYDLFSKNQKIDRIIEVLTECKKALSAQWYICHCINAVAPLGFKDHVKSVLMESKPSETQFTEIYNHDAFKKGSSVSWWSITYHGTTEGINQKKLYLDMLISKLESQRPWYIKLLKKFKL